MQGALNATNVFQSLAVKLNKPCISYQTYVAPLLSVFKDVTVTNSRSNIHSASSYSWQAAC